MPSKSNIKVIRTTVFDQSDNILETSIHRTTTSSQSNERTKRTMEVNPILLAYNWIGECFESIEEEIEEIWDSNTPLVFPTYRKIKETIETSRLLKLVIVTLFCFLIVLPLTSYSSPLSTHQYKFKEYSPSQYVAKVLNPLLSVPSMFPPTSRNDLKRFAQKVVSKKHHQTIILFVYEDNNTHARKFIKAYVEAIADISDNTTNFMDSADYYEKNVFEEQLSKGIVSGQLSVVWDIQKLRVGLPFTLHYLSDIDTTPRKESFWIATVSMPSTFKERCSGEMYNFLKEKWIGNHPQLNENQVEAIISRIGIHTICLV